MTKATLEQEIKNKQSFLCIGLDPDPGKMPPHLLQKEDAVFEFNRAIIEATHDLAVAYKPNFAFYEALGKKGWNILYRTAEIIPEGILKIADAKRGDIGNTSHQYAKAIFEEMNFDAVTIAPYMGHDSVQPFLTYKDKWTIVLALTSNPGSGDFQRLEVEGKPVYQHVLRKCSEWGTPENLMFVFGATHPDDLLKIREIIPQHFLLIPGVGAQGGSLKEVAQNGMTGGGGLLVNASRSIIYAGKGEDFAQKARKAALALQQEMATILQEKELV